jgi:glycosyltransferase involved in cell wall biosynthesis
MRDLWQSENSKMEPGKGKMKKVLMVARVFPPFNPVGHSIRVVKFIKFLPALGWMPVVLTIDDKREYEYTRKVGSETLLAEIRPQVKIYRTSVGEPSIKYLDKEKKIGQRNWLAALIVKVLSGGRRWVFRNLLLPDRNAAWLPFALKLGRQIVESEGIDVIYATCTPHSATLVGALLKRLTRKPLILDFRDDWIDAPPYRSKPKIIRSIERKMESWVVKIADKVILVTDWSQNAFHERYPMQPSDKFVLIPNGCDLEEFEVLKSMPAAPRNSKFTIVHAGSLNDSPPWTRSPATFFQAIHQLLQQQPELADDLALVFVGNFPESFRKLADKLGLCGVVKGLGHLPHDEVLRLTKSADLLLAIGSEGCSTMIPGKIYEYWAVGGPAILLIKCRGAAASFVEQHSLGLTVEPSDVVGIKQAVMSVYRRSKTAIPMRVNNAGIKAYDRQELTRKLAAVLFDLERGYSKKVKLHHNI